MSRGLCRANNTNAHFIVSRPVRTTYFWGLGRNTRFVREESAKPDQHVESSVSSESAQPSQYASDTECPNCRCFNCTCNDGSLPNPHGDSCTCPNCREYADYTAHIADLIDPQRERSSTGIWIGNELRSTECANTDATTRTNNNVGLPTGATV